MSFRSLLLVPLVASGFLAPALHADRLLVAGPDGFVMATDTARDDLQYFTCTCNGPIRAMAADARRLYVADDFEQIVVFGRDDGALRTFIWPGIGRIDALAAGGNELFAGAEDGSVARIDPLTGTVLDVRLAPAGVRGLVVHDGNLIASTSDGALWRAPQSGGDFQYFTCFCLGAAKNMVGVGDDFFIMDDWGNVVRVDASSGAIVNGFWAGDASSMAASRTELFFYYDTPGTVARFDPQTGLQLPGKVTSPIAVNAMLVVPEARTKVRIGTLPQRMP
jgi:hypothetical protein